MILSFSLIKKANVLLGCPWYMKRLIMKKQPAHILIIDDNEDILLSARLYLRQHFTHIETSTTPRQINQLLNEREYDVILLDMNYRKGESDGREGLYWLEYILSLDRSNNVILMTAYGDVELAVKALKMGASDFILKPWPNEKLLATISSALKLHETSKKLKKAEDQHQSLQNDLYRRFTTFESVSPAMKKITKVIEKVAPSDANVLILGENGTGKQVAAREIHQKSHRAEQVFMHVDLGSLNENLFESELFGYVKGAFTDAREDKPGRFEIADGGTLFLDEIGNLSLPLQGKLLTVLQNRKVTRLGESRDRDFDIRLICATNRPLDLMVREGTFREDLLYRINTVIIDLPALMERTEDIVPLANHFLHIYANKYQKPKVTLSVKAAKTLEKYKWPGNIRELQHVMERAVIMSEDDRIEDTDLNLTKIQSTFTKKEKLDLGEMEKTMVQKALKKSQGNISRAAEELGLTRAALYRRMDKYNL